MKGTFRCPICMIGSPHGHDKRRWLGVDLDGTLAYDTNRTDPYSIGPPIAPMVSRVKQWLAAGFTVKLLTARMNEMSYSSNQLRDLGLMEQALRAWCKEHIGEELECTMSKDGLMEVLWDDRAVRVIRDTGMPDISYE